MAQSRLEKIGTIYSKVRGFLASGAIKTEQIPLWYDVYEAFPPKYEPRWDRKPEEKQIKKILYQEDIIRAKFYQQFGNAEIVDLTSPGKLTSQIFIERYLSLREKGESAETLWNKTVQSLELDGVNLSGIQAVEAEPQKQKLSLQELFEKESK